MQSITFATPTLTTTQMTRQDQIDISVNQAAAVVVCCYLEHLNTAIQKGIPGATQAGPGSSGTAFLTTTELVTLINNVQGALATVP
jgi:hypothetical protein